MFVCLFALLRAQQEQGRGKGRGGMGTGRWYNVAKCVKREANFCKMNIKLFVNSMNLFPTRQPGSALSLQSSSASAECERERETDMPTPNTVKQCMLSVCASGSMLNVHTDKHITRYFAYFMCPTKPKRTETKRTQLDWIELNTLPCVCVCVCACNIHFADTVAACRNLFLWLIASWREKQNAANDF